MPRKAADAKKIHLLRIQTGAQTPSVSFCLPFPRNKKTTNLKIVPSRRGDFSEKSGMARMILPPVWNFGGLQFLGSGRIWISTDASCQVEATSKATSISAFALWVAQLGTRVRAQSDPFPIPNVTSILGGNPKGHQIAAVDHRWNRGFLTSKSRNLHFRQNRNH